MIGQLIDGRYRITSHLSDGGMGSVYIAEHIQLSRQVAVKTLRADVADPETAAKRFEIEARAASEIDHPNVVQVLDFGQLDNGDFYYAMELLQGRDFSQLLREQGRLPWPRVHKLARQLVKALAAAHGRGIVHRDIKPANCFLLDPRPGLADDHVKVLDFGIAKRDESASEEAQHLTQDCQVVGTAAYMAPEQVLTGKTDPRSDIYALGVVFYELLAGQPPFRGDTPMQTITHHINTPPPSLRELDPELPPEVEAFVMRMLVKDPDARFQTMEEVAAVLDALGDPTGAATLTALGIDLYAAPTAVVGAAGGRAQAPEPAGGRAWMLALALLLMVLGGGGFIASTMADEPSPPAPPEGPSEPAQPIAEGPVEQQLPPPPPTSDPFGGGWDGFVPEPAGKSRCADESLSARAWEGEPGSMSGQVRGGEAKPLPGAQVCAWLVDEQAPTEFKSVPHCVQIQNPKGRYRLDGLPPGHYELSTFAAEHLPSYKLPVRVCPGEDTSAVHVDLEAGGVEVRGQVLDAHGVAIAGALITVTNGPRALARADAQGRFRLWVEEGPLRLMAWAKGYTHALRSGEAGAQAFEFELQREALIVGKVVEAGSEEPIAGASITASYKFDPRDAAGVGFTAYSDAQGAFHVVGLAPGLCWVRAELPDGSEALVHAQLKPGVATHVPIEVGEPEPEEASGNETGEDSGSETGEETGTETGTETGEDENLLEDLQMEEPPPPEVRVVFVAGKLKWAELRISGRVRGVAEPRRALRLSVGVHRVQYRKGSGPWQDAGTIELRAGKEYEARLGRGSVQLIDKP